MLGGLFLAVLLIVGGIGFGIVRHKNLKEKQAFAAAGIEAMEQGGYETAIASFDQALEKSRGKIGALEKDVLLYRAEAEYKQGDFPAAANTYALLLKADKDNEEYKKGMVLCMLETGDYEEALNLGVLQGSVYNRMAVDEIAAGRYDKALEYIMQGKTLADEASGKKLAYNEVAVWENKNDFKKALELLEAYAGTYGTDETVERELTFLRSRQGSH